MISSELVLINNNVDSNYFRVARFWNT